MASSGDSQSSVWKELHEADKVYNSPRHRGPGGGRVLPCTFVEVQPVSAKLSPPPFEAVLKLFKLTTTYSQAGPDVRAQFDRFQTWAIAEKQRLLEAGEDGQRFQQYIVKGNDGKAHWCTWDELPANLKPNELEYVCFNFDELVAVTYLAWDIPCHYAEMQGTDLPSVNDRIVRKRRVAGGAEVVVWMQCYLRSKTWCLVTVVGAGANGGHRVQPKQHPRAPFALGDCGAPHLWSILAPGVDYATACKPYPATSDQMAASDITTAASGEYMEEDEVLLSYNAAQLAATANAAMAAYADAYEQAAAATVAHATSVLFESLAGGGIDSETAAALAAFEAQAENVQQTAASGAADRATEATTACEKALSGYKAAAAAAGIGSGVMAVGGSQARAAVAAAAPRTAAGQSVRAGDVVKQQLDAIRCLLGADSLTTQLQLLPVLLEVLRLLGAMAHTAALTSGVPIEAAITAAAAAGGDAAAAGIAAVVASRPLINAVMTAHIPNAHKQRTAVAGQGAVRTAARTAKAAEKEAALAEIALAHFQPGEHVNQVPQQLAGQLQQSSQQQQQQTQAAQQQHLPPVSQQQCAQPVKPKDSSAAAGAAASAPAPARKLRLKFKPKLAAAAAAAAGAAAAGAAGAAAVLAAVQPHSAAPSQAAGSTSGSAAASTAKDPGPARRGKLKLSQLKRTTMKKLRLTAPASGSNG